MKQLSDQDSRKLFVNRIFGSQEAGLDVPEEISADILKKCGGLPLAIISTASLLAHNPRSRWDSVRNSLVSMFEGDQDELKQMERILDLSYMHLPHHLKTCLRVCTLKALCTTSFWFSQISNNSPHCLITKLLPLVRGCHIHSGASYP